MPNELSQPVGPVSFNRSHPLARGLVAAWLLNESPSRVLTCATNNPLSDISVGSDANWVYNTGRVGLQHGVPTGNSTQSRIPFDRDNVASLRGATELSIYARVRYDPGGGGAETIYACADNASGAPRNGFALQTFNIDDLYFWNCYATNTFDSGAINFFAGETGNDVAVAFRWSGSNCRYWKNGQFFADTTITSQPVSSEITSAFIGCIGSSRYWNDALYEIYLWDRVLSDHEAYQVYADPYVVFEPPAPDAIFISAPPSGPQLSGAATATKATSLGVATITPQAALSGSATASKATANGAATISVVPGAFSLAGSANTEEVLGTGNLVKVGIQSLSGSATASKAGGSGSIIYTPAPGILSGSATANKATGLGSINLPEAGLDTLSGAATADKATALGSALILEDNLLSGAATARDATATGSIIVKKDQALSGAATADKATGTGSAAIIQLTNTLAGAATVRKATATGTAVIPILYPDQGELLHVQPEVSDLNVLNETPTRRR